MLHNVCRPAPRSPPDRDGVEVVDSDLLLGLQPAPAAAPPGWRRPLEPSPAAPIHVRLGPRLRVSRRASSGRHPAPVLGRCVRFAVPAAAASGLRRPGARRPAPPEDRAAVAGGQPGRRAGPQPGAGQAAHALYHQPLASPSGPPPRHGHARCAMAVAACAAPCGGAWGWGSSSVRHCCGGEGAVWERGRRSRQRGEGPQYFPVLPPPLPLRGASACPCFPIRVPRPGPGGGAGPWRPGPATSPASHPPGRTCRPPHPQSRGRVLPERARRGYAALSLTVLPDRHRFHTRFARRVSLFPHARRRFHPRESREKKHVYTRIIRSYRQWPGLGPAPGSHRAPKPGCASPVPAPASTSATPPAFRPQTPGLASVMMAFGGDT